MFNFSLGPSIISIEEVSFHGTSALINKKKTLDTEYKT